MSDKLDDFLERKVACDPNGAVKNAIRLETTRLLRWRRRGKYTVWAALLLVPYLAGLGTMRLLGPVQPMPPALMHATTLQVQSKPEQPATEPPPAETATLVEMQARQHPKQQGESVRLGDLYVEQEADYVSALRCYGQALNAAGPDALEYSDDDNFLVLAIKSARRKELKNEQ